MSILVTGASGHVGSNLARRFYQKGAKVVAHDLYPPNPKGVLHEIIDKIVFVRGDIRDLADLIHTIKDHDVEGIIHTTVIGTHISNRNPLNAVRVNIEGTVNVLELARCFNLRRVVYLSSASAAGGFTDLSRKNKEADINLPLSGVYPVTKLCCEGLCHNYKNEFGVDVIVIRTSRVYGPGFYRTEGTIPIEELITMVMKGDVVLERGSDTPIDYTYVKDIAQGLILAYEAKKPNHLIYNMSFGELRDIGQVVQVLRKIFHDRKIEIGPGLWGDFISEATFQGKVYKLALRQALDIGRARSDLGYNPEFDIDKGLPDYVAWLTERRY